MTCNVHVAYFRADRRVGFHTMVGCCMLCAVCCKLWRLGPQVLRLIEDRHFANEVSIYARRAWDVCWPCFHFGDVVLKHKHTVCGVRSYFVNNKPSKAQACLGGTPFTRCSVRGNNQVG